MKYVLASVLFIGAGALLFSSIRDLIRKFKARKANKIAKENLKHECQMSHDSVDGEEVSRAQSVPDKADEAKDS